MTRRCVRCQWSSTGDDAKAKATEHAAEAGHPLCIVCGLSVPLEQQQTCPRCEATARADLADVVELYALLPVVMVDARYGQPQAPRNGSRSTDTPMPGGDVLALHAPGSDGRAQTRAILRGEPVPHAGDEYATDVPSVAYELGRWEDDWRLTRAEPEAATLLPDPGNAPARLAKRTVTSAASYLMPRTTWAAQQHPAFDEYSHDLTKLRSRLLQVTSRSTGPQRGVPCIYCRAPLERKYLDRKLNPGCAGHPDRCAWPHVEHGCRDTGGRVEDWTCPKCKRTYDDQHYTLAVAMQYQEHRDAGRTA